MGDAVIAVGIDKRITLINAVCEKLVGYKADQVYGKSLDSVFIIINEYTRENRKSPADLVFETGEIVQLANHTLLISRDGTERAIEDTAAPIKNKSGETVGCVIVFRDFSDQREKQKQIEYLSYHDQLTGLYNRRFFEEELKRISTKRNLPLSMVYADVNGLKTINDAFGHDQGDILIRMVANTFKEECRTDDILARVGGDEFVLLLPRTDTFSSEKLLKRITGKMEQNKILDIELSVSFGWCTMCDDNQTAFDILKSAEDSMYRKKLLSLSSRRSGMIQSINNALLIKSPREKAHSQRVSHLCEEIGKAYGLREEELSDLRVAGELHDIGKIAVDEKILNKSEKLSPVEWAQMQGHSETGYRLLGATLEYSNIAEYVFGHHERWDGTGYPKRLKGKKIRWESRVIAIADAYDAMTSDRPYRKAQSEAAAVAEIKKNAGTQFDPEIARTFIEKVKGYVW